MQFDEIERGRARIFRQCHERKDDSSRPPRTARKYIETAPAPADKNSVMVSLKPYLTSNHGEDVLRQVVVLLLEKLAAAAAIATDEEYAVFRDDIARLRQCVGPEATPQEILLAAGSATQALEAYNRGVTASFRKRGRELRDIVGMLAETVATMGGENTRSVEKLREIGNGLERANCIEDLPTLKVHLGECLHSFRQEIARQKDQADSVIIALRQQIEQSPQLRLPPSADKGTDPVTHLGTKEECLKAMHAPIAPGRRKYVVTLVVNRMQSINIRFGYQVGDRILCRFGEFIEQQIRPEDRLFRWSGPAFVALIERTEALNEVRAQIKRILEPLIEETLEVGGRSLLIPISAAWSAFHFITTVATAERQIETFAASQTSREYV
jgi:diguanylate cyclase (GGDEF)-like protein